MISQVPDSAATIIPFDVESRVHLLHARNAAQSGGRRPGQPGGDQVEPGTVREKEKEQPTATGTRPQRVTAALPAVTGNGAANGTANGVTSIAALGEARKATIEGRVSSVEIRPVENSCVFEATIADGTGSLTVMFYGRTHIPGLEPGARIRLDGKVSMRTGGPAMINPAYELLAKDEVSRPAAALLLAEGDQLVGGVDHHRLAALEPDRAAEPDPRAADQAGDVRPAVEHRGEVAGRVVDLHREHRVPLDRADLDHPDLPLHRDLAAGDGADRGDAGRGDRGRAS